VAPAPGISAGVTATTSILGVPLSGSISMGNPEAVAGPSGTQEERVFDVESASSAGSSVEYIETRLAPVVVWRDPANPVTGKEH